MVILNNNHDGNLEAFKFEQVSIKYMTEGQHEKGDRGSDFKY